MQDYAVVVENDITQWEDDTGSRYHFPRRYARYLRPGTRLLHYKGRLTDPNFLSKRLSPEPHYFAVSIAGEHIPDPNGDKNALFVRIEDYQPFDKPVPHRVDGETIEVIPENRRTNFWRDGVRPTNFAVFKKATALAGLFVDEGAYEPQAVDDDLTTVLEEGGKKVYFGTRYERRPELRAAAIRMHGTACFACEVHMRDIYGDLASGYVHIHHRKPLSVSGPTTVDARTDLVPLCPNCHAIVHLGGTVKSVNEIRSLLGKPPIANGG